MFQVLCNELCIRAQAWLKPLVIWLAAWCGLKVVEPDTRIISDVPIWRVSGMVRVGNEYDAHEYPFSVEIKHVNNQSAKKLAIQQAHERYPAGWFFIMGCDRIDHPQPRSRQRVDISGRGYIYLVEGQPGRFKIGLSADPKTRIANLGVKLPFEIEVIHLISTDDMRRAERELHDQFRDRRLAGEWFDLTPEQVQSVKKIGSITYGEVLQ